MLHQHRHQHQMQQRVFQQQALQTQFIDIINLANATKMKSATIATLPNV